MESEMYMIKQHYEREMEAQREYYQGRINSLERDIPV